MRKYLFCFVACLVLTMSCEKKDNPSDPEPPLPQISYLDAWTGTYTGTSREWMEYPTSTGFVFHESYRQVRVEVAKAEMDSLFGNTDSLLNLKFIYEDTIITERAGLKFTADGRYYSNWGGGSGFGSLEIQFDSVSLNYVHFQKCGIPCSSGSDFHAMKQNRRRPL